MLQTKPFLGPLEFLFCGVPEHLRYRTPLIMLVAYLDDSGSEQKGHAFVLAGYVAPAEKWNDFNQQWQACLDEEPRIEYFKMIEAHRRKGEFRSFSEAQRDDRVVRLSRIFVRGE